LSDHQTSSRGATGVPPGILWVSALIGIAIVGLLGARVYQERYYHGATALTTPYHAVLLINGQAFFGHLEGLDTDHPVLRDVYYIQSQQNPETKQVTNVLVKRGREWHAPDRMILNKQHLLLVEPVKEDSQVAKLIEEQKKQQR
jgi:hypothetical protein